jgi:hypothetical protein
MGIFFCLITAVGDDSGKSASPSCVAPTTLFGFLFVVVH